MTTDDNSIREMGMDFEPLLKIVRYITGFIIRVISLHPVIQSMCIVYLYGCMCVWAIVCIRYMGVWVHVCIGVWVYGLLHVLGVWEYGCMGYCMYMDVWMYGCMGVWMYGCMGVWVYGCMGVWVYGFIQSTLKLLMRL